MLPFTELQKRIGRKNLSTKILSELPVILQTYDLLEYEGRDILAARVQDTANQFLAEVMNELPKESQKVIFPFFCWEPAVGNISPESASKAARSVSKVYAQAAKFPVPRRPSSRRLVEMEDRPADHRLLRPDLRGKKAQANALTCLPTILSPSGRATTLSLSPKPIPD